MRCRHCCILLYKRNWDDVKVIYCLAAILRCQNSLPSTSRQLSIKGCSGLSCIRRNMRNLLLSDIDGTLVDSNALHAEAWRRAFEHFGIEIGLDEAWKQIGKGGDQLIPVFVAEKERKRLEVGIKEFRK